MISRAEGYTLTKLAGHFYLIPFGQTVADLRRGMELNATAALLWEALKLPKTEEALYQTFAAAEGIEAADEADARADLHAFLHQMTAHGILTEEAAPSAKADAAAVLRIAGIRLRLFGQPEWIHPSLLAFSDDTSDPVRATLDIHLFAVKPLPLYNATLIIRNHELVLTKTDALWQLFYPTFSAISEMRMRTDGTEATLYLQPFAADADTLREQIFLCLRTAFLHLAEKFELYALHSASIEYQKRAVLFSAPSGTGKSTHAALWEQYANAPVLNGDLNLIGLTETGPVVYGMPWCGTSGIFTTRTVPLDSIVLLKQLPEDKVLPLPKEERELQVFNRFISTSWTEAMVLQKLDFVQKLEPTIRILKFGCTKEPHAFLVLHSALSDPSSKR